MSYHLFSSIYLPVKRPLISFIHILLFMLLITLGFTFFGNSVVSKQFKIQQVKPGVNSNTVDGNSLTPSILITTPHNIFIPIILNDSASQPTTTIVTPEDGGELILPNGLGKFTFAPRTVSDPVKVVYTAATLSPDAPSKWTKIGTGFDVSAYTLSSGVEVTDFLTYTTEISIPYNPSSLPAGSDPRLVSIFYWHEQAQRWVRMPTLHRVDAKGQPILWTRTSHLTEFAVMTVKTNHLAVVVLDPDENFACLQDGRGNCNAVEWNYNLHSVLQIKTLLEACGVTVNMTVEDIMRSAPAGGHQLTREERVEMIREGDIGLTVAHNSHNNGFVSAGMGGSESWFSTRASMGSEDSNFATALLNAITSRTGLTNRGPKFGEDYTPPRYWFLSDELANLAPVKPYAQIEVGFLTLVQDRQRIDYDYAVGVDDYDDVSQHTNFAFPIYLTIMNQLGLTNCDGLACLPNNGLTIDNQPRLAPPVEITDPFFTEEGIKYASDIEENASLDETYRQIRGEDSTTYVLKPGVSITEDTYLPLTSTLYTEGVGWASDPKIPGVLTVSATNFVSTTSGLIPAPHLDTVTGNNRIYRPIEYSFFGGVFQLAAGLMPWFSDQTYTPTEIDALQAGSCQGLTYMTAAFCAGLYKPDDPFGVRNVGSLRDDGLFATYLNYFQMIQVYLSGKDVSATTFFEQTKSRMQDPSAWSQDPDLLRLIYQPPDSCDSWGHVLLPYSVLDDASSNTMVMYVYDPNYPQNNDIKVTLDKTTGVWTYAFSPTETWTGNEVNYVRLSEFPDYGVPVEDVIGEDAILVTDGASDYGRPRASYGALRVSFGRPRASYGEDKDRVRMGQERDAADNLICDNEIGGARRLNFNYSLFPGSDWKPPQVLLLPQADYIFTFGEPRFGQIAAGTFYAKDAMYTFNGTSGKGGRDNVEINNDLSVITHTTTLNAKALSISMYRETEDQTRIFGVSHTPLQAGEKSIFRASEEDDNFEYINNGVSKTYDLSLIQVSGHGPGIFTEQDVIIGSGERHIVNACNWDDLENTLIFRWIDCNNDDSIDKTQLLSEFPFLSNPSSQQKISALAMDGYDYWFGTSGTGVVHYRVDTKVTTIYDTHNSALLHDVINDIAIAPNGDVWVATNRGASKFSGGNWQNYTEIEGLIDKNVNAIDISAAGVVWFGTNQGLSRYENGVWTSYTKAEGLPHNQIKALAVDADGTLWLMTANGIVVRYNGTAWEKVGGLSNGNVDTMTAVDGIIWFGTNQGLVKYEMGLFTKVGPDQVNINEATHDRSNKVCRAGIVWVVSENGKLGLYDHNKDRWLILPEL